MPDDDLDRLMVEHAVPLDPSQRTLEQLIREISSLKELLTARLNAVEKAQEKFEESITRFPTEVDRAVKQLRELLEVMIQANAKLVEVQAKASEEAISKTERSVENRLSQMGVLFESKTTTLTELVQDQGRRLTGFESRTAGQVDARSAAQDSQKLWISIGGFALAAMVVLTTVVIFLNRPVPQPERVVERMVPEKPERIIERVIERPAAVIERPNGAGESN